MDWEELFGDLCEEIEAPEIAAINLDGHSEKAIMCPICAELGATCGNCRKHLSALKEKELWLQFQNEKE